MKDESNLKKGEAGQALVLVTVILLLSALVVPPLLGLNFSSTRSAQISEDRMLQLYAADAGIEDALYLLKHRLMGNATEMDYHLADDLNTCGVDVNIFYVGDGVYKITSTALDTDGANTVLESYVALADYSFLTEYALATDGDVTIGNNGIITGDVRCGSVDNPGAITGEITEGEEIRNWPPADEISGFYMDDVEGLTPYEGTPKANEYRINGNKNNPTVVDPLYRIGDLEFIGNNKYGSLSGTVYVADDIPGAIDGDLTFGPGVTVDLNGQSIFVEGAIYMAPNAGCLGSGCIIAIGDINFQPHVEGDEDDFIFIMSIGGSINVQPGGNFYGTLAAAGGINFQPGCGVFKPGELPDTLNLPGMDDVIREIRSIETYTIKTGG